MSQNNILSSIPSARQVYKKDITIELEQYGIADYVILPSLHAKESFIEEGEKIDKLFVNPYGVNLKMFHPLPLESDGYDIIFVGNWSLQKGVDILVEACKKRGIYTRLTAPASIKVAGGGSFIIDGEYYSKIVVPSLSLAQFKAVATYSDGVKDGVKWVLISGKAESRT